MFGAIVQTFECETCEHRWTQNRPPGTILLERAFRVPAGNGCAKCWMSGRLAEEEADNG
jgi:hypothetical protein